MELQKLLDANPTLAAAQFTEDDRLVTVSVADGIPHITRGPRPATSSWCFPSATEIQGSTIYRLYYLMVDLRCLDEERLQEGAAHLLAHTPVEEVAAARMDNPERPTAAEILNTTLLDDAALNQTAPGMFHHLATLQRRLADKLVKHPELETIRLRTASQTVEIRAANRCLSVRPTPLPGQPYVEVRETPQVRLYLLQQAIQDLETVLYGQPQSIEVNGPGFHREAELQLLQQLQQLQCDHLMVPIRRSRKTLYIAGAEHQLIYAPFRIRAGVRELHVDDQAQVEPERYRRVEYRELSPVLQHLLQALFVYLSTRTAHEACSH